MRSSKSRSRSKGNRSRSMGNIVNRVFDSSGPEGKVRGTPQQIIDKYTQLARDATLGNDRVAAENFQQHAEHYARMLGEAQREMEARREQQEAQQRDRHRERQDNNQNNQNNQSGGGMQPADPSRSAQPDVIEDVMESAPQPDIASAPNGGTISVVEDAPGDSGLVDTPESAPKPKPKAKPRTRARKPRAEKVDEAAPKAAAETAADAPAGGDPADKAAE